MLTPSEGLAKMRGEKRVLALLRFETGDTLCPRLRRPGCRSNLTRAQSPIFCDNWWLRAEGGISNSVFACASVVHSALSALACRPCPVLHSVRHFRRDPEQVQFSLPNDLLGRPRG